jgi:phage-related protein
VKEKFDDLASSLAKKYQESQAAVAEEIEAAQEANKGLIDKAVDAVKGVIRVIAQLKDMILNVLSRIASVMGEIIAHPIKFLKNFVNAVKNGITRFMDRIGEHLQKGLMGWLFGALDAKGIEIPDSFSIEGIFKLVLSVLGVTWLSIREKIAKKIGEPAMTALENGADLIKRVVVGGPGVLWELLKEKFTEFESMVVGEIKNFVIEKVVKSGITFLISLLNPAAAFIKACKMIYDVVMFFVEKGSEIKEFVDTVIDAAGDVARGGTGGIAEKIEGVLAKLLPLAISFLANILGLGGVGEKVHSIIDKVRKPIHKAMDKVIDVVVKTTAPIWKPAKKLFEKGKKLYGKAKDKVVGAYEKGKAKVKEVGAKAKDLAKAGVAKVKGVGKKVKDTATAARDKVVSLFKPQKQPTTMNGAGHTLIAEPAKNGRFKVYMQSEKGLLSSKITHTIAALEQRMATEAGPAREGTAAQIAQLREIGETASILESLNPEGKKVTHMGAPEGFETEMRLLSEKVATFGNKHKLKDIKPEDANTQVDLRMLAQFGMPVPSYLQAQDVADRKNAAIDIRATTVGAPELLAKGFQPKSDKFKQKTMNEADELLGAPPEHRDRVIWFLPSRPKPQNFEGYPDRLKAAWARWKQRKDEYYDNLASMKKKLRDGQIALRPLSGLRTGGLVEGPVKAKHVEDLLGKVAYTGDHDIFQVHGNAGTVIEALKDPPFRVQHGAHMDWPATVREAEGRELSPMEQDIFDAIVQKHLKSEALLRINPHGPPTIAFADTPVFKKRGPGGDGGAGGGGDDFDVAQANEPSAGGGQASATAPGSATASEGKASAQLDKLNQKHAGGVSKPELDREVAGVKQSLPEVEKLTVVPAGDHWAYDLQVSRTLKGGPLAAGGAGGGAGAGPMTIADLRKALSAKAVEGMDQFEELSSPARLTNILERGFRNPPGTGAFDVAKVQAKFEKEWMSAADFTAKKAARVANLHTQADNVIATIDRICTQTTIKGRPNATIGDGSTESAVEHEAKTGTHHPKSPSGHVLKAQTNRNGLRDAIDSLDKLKLQIVDKAKLAEIDKAIDEARDRIRGLERAFPIWNGRLSDTSVWNADGTSKATPGWPPANARGTNFS